MRTLQNLVYKWLSRQCVFCPMLLVDHGRLQFSVLLVLFTCQLPLNLDVS
jgi:hypothetical protein